MRAIVASPFAGNVVGRAGQGRHRSLQAAAMFNDGRNIQYQSHFLLFQVAAVDHGVRQVDGQRFLLRDRDGAVSDDTPRCEACAKIAVSDNDRFRIRVSFIELSHVPGQVQGWQTHTDQLAAMGFTIEPFGGQSILVQGIPASLKNWSEGRLLLDILDDLAWDDKPSRENQVDLLASYACHAAVRAGESLTLPEMQNLVDRLFATDTPLSCPHGRPTLIQFSLAELEKRFGRS